MSLCLGSLKSGRTAPAHRGRAARGRGLTTKKKIGCYIFFFFFFFVPAPTPRAAFIFCPHPPFCRTMCWAYCGTLSVVNNFFRKLRVVALVFAFFRPPAARPLLSLRSSSRGFPSSGGSFILHLKRGLGRFTDSRGLCYRRCCAKQAQLPRGLRHRTAPQGRSPPPALRAGG